MRTDAAQIEGDAEGDLECDLARQQERVDASTTPPTISAPIDKPLGLDVAGPIMMSISPVTQSALARLHQIVERCHRLADLFTTSEAAIDEKLKQRDDETRDLVTRHGKLNLAVETELGRIDAAIDKIVAEHKSATDN